MFASRRAFHFSPGVSLLALAAAALCYSMSFWQYSRYRWKQAYLAQVEVQEKAGRAAYDPQRATDPAYRHALVRMSGQFDYEREVVLLNRSINEQPGVQVVTPFKLASGETLLVLRGFLPYNLWVEKKVTLYRMPGEQMVEGTVMPSQTKTFFLSPPVHAGTVEAPKETWFRLDVAEISKQLPYPVTQIYVEQTNQEPPLLFDKKEVVPASRHLNYTIQWASFATFAIIWALFIQFKKRGVIENASEERKLIAKDP